MGNTTNSKLLSKNKYKVPGMIDQIASKYILTQDFDDLTKLESKDYCDKLVILTSNIIAEHLTDLEIEYLSQRTKEGKVIDEMTTDKILYFQDTTLKRLDIQSATKKKRVCIGIARFYIKIMHIFSAIVGTMNPIYSYRNEAGKIEKVPFMKKKSIPLQYKDSIRVNKLSLCANRINAILMKEFKDIDESDTTTIDLKPRICTMNNKQAKPSGDIDALTTISKPAVSVKSLADEPGIPELKKLYLDIFDYTIGKFTKMSKKSQEQYQKDLKQFYTVFTGNKTMPDTIKEFSDIKLRNYAAEPNCKPNGALTKIYRGTLKNKLFSKYAKQIKIMTDNANKNREQLLQVLDQLFRYTIDPETKNKNITIHPNITHKQLNKIVETTRNIIVKLYISCEQDFLGILQLFETIIETQVKENTQRKINNIKKQEEGVLAKVDNIEKHLPDIKI